MLLVQASHDMLVLQLELPSHLNLHFHADEFAKINFGVLPLRIYSMASQPGDRYLESHICIVLQGVVSQHVLHELIFGAIVAAQGRFGGAYWVRPEVAFTEPFLLVAGEIGLAPILPMPDSTLASG